VGEESTQNITCNKNEILIFWIKSYLFLKKKIVIWVGCKKLPQIKIYGQSGLPGINTILTENSLIQNKYSTNIIIVNRKLGKPSEWKLLIIIIK